MSRIPHVPAFFFQEGCAFPLVNFCRTIIYRIYRWIIFPDCALLSANPYEKIALFLVCGALRRSWALSDRV